MGSWLLIWECSRSCMIHVHCSMRGTWRTYLRPLCLPQLPLKSFARQARRWSLFFFLGLLPFFLQEWTAAGLFPQKYNPGKIPSNNWVQRIVFRSGLLSGLHSQETHWMTFRVWSIWSTASKAKCVICSARTATRVRPWVLASPTSPCSARYRLAWKMHVIHDLCNSLLVKTSKKWSRLGSVNLLGKLNA